MRRGRKNRKFKNIIKLCLLSAAIIFIGVIIFHSIFGKSDNKIVSVNGNKNNIIVNSNDNIVAEENDNSHNTNMVVNNKDNSDLNNINKIDNNLSSDDKNDDVEENEEITEDDSVESYVVDESDEVEDSYFDNAVFIGDSRTEGFIMFNKLSNVNALTTKGLMVDTVFTKKAINKNGKKMTVSQALKSSTFDKVYIMLGVNELGWVYSDVFINKYKKIIDYVRQINKDSIIYIQSIIPVSKKKSDSDKIYNNTNINNYNKLIKEMCKDKKVYFINVREEIIDENGCLPVGASVDGVHLNREYCYKWYDYLKTHTVNQN